MKHILSDGRVLMASYSDIDAFFQAHSLIGRRIADLRPAVLDYMIRNPDDVEDLTSLWVESAVDTDGQICLIFEDGDTLEIEYCGDGPILLGFNTTDLSRYPQEDGSCYTLRTLFQHCIGAEIANVLYRRSRHRMLFPVYHGIDMSSDNDGIREIRFLLRGGSSLVASGKNDHFKFRHILDSWALNSGEPVKVRLRDLLQELSDGGQSLLQEKEDAHEEEQWESFSSTEIIEEIDEVLGTFGFRDKSGKIMIEPQFLSCGWFHHGLCPVALGRTWYTTPQGRRLCEMHWGYIDKRGKTVIPFKYRKAYSFNRYGVATVIEEYGKEAYLINTAGEELENSRHIYVSHYYDFEDRFIAFSPMDPSGETHIGLYDTKLKKIMYPPIITGCVIQWNEDCICISELGNDLADAELYIEYDRYINSRGEEIYPQLTSKGYHFISPPNEQGYAVVGKRIYTELPDSAKSYNYVGADKKKYACVTRSGVAGPDGELVIPMEYEHIQDRRDGSYTCKNGSQRSRIWL